MTPSLTVLIAKRAMDVFIGLAGTFVFLFCYPLVGLLIRLESPGAILYSQERVGINRRRPGRRRTGTPKTPGTERRKADCGGKPFHIYKFRTMRLDAEAQGPQLCRKGADPRVTRIGRWLRALHIDELPQFWNVLKGDMSFIGPRPERPHFTLKYAETIPHYSERTLYVKPGITGLAQIVLGYDDSHESVVRKVHFDLSYGASLSAFRSWLRMEWWVLSNTFFYYLIKPNLEGETRELDGLKRAKLLPFHGRSPLKDGREMTIATVRTGHQVNPLIIRGRDTGEIASQLESLELNLGKGVEICLKPDKRFDLDDLGFLVRIAHQVNKAGGHLALRDAPPQVRRILHEIHLDKSVEMVRSNTSISNFMTIDVECWFHAYNLKEKVPKSTWHLQETRIHEDIRRILDLLRFHEAKATFFTLGWVADRFPEVVRMIDREGHEIGTHGYHHDLITDMTPDQFEADLEKSLNALSRLTSQPIRGHRASNFTVVESTLWALEIMARYGITYDSSIFPVKRARYGIPDYPNRMPHRVQLHNGVQLTEIPMSTLKVGRKLVPMAGGGYLRLYPAALTESFVAHMNSKGLPAMVYFHPWEVDDTQQRMKVGTLKSFQHYVNLETTEWKLARLLERFRFTSVRENLETRRIKHLLERNPVAIQAPDQGRPLRGVAFHAEEDDNRKAIA